MEIDVDVVLLKGALSTNDNEVRIVEVRCVTTGCLRGCAEILKESGGLCKHLMGCLKLRSEWSKSCKDRKSSGLKRVWTAYSCTISY